MSSPVSHHQKELSFEECVYWLILIPKSIAVATIIGEMQREWGPVHQHALEFGVDPNVVIGRKRARTPSPDGRSKTRSLSPSPSTATVEPPPSPSPGPSTSPVIPVPVPPHKPQTARTSRPTKQLPSRPRARTSYRPLPHNPSSASCCKPEGSSPPAGVLAQLPGTANDMKGKGKALAVPQPQPPKKRTRTRIHRPNVDFICGWAGCKERVFSEEWQMHMKSAHQILGKAWENERTPEQQICLHDEYRAGRSSGRKENARPTSAVSGTASSSSGSAKAEDADASNRDWDSDDAPEGTDEDDMDVDEQEEDATDGYVRREIDEDYDGE
ncbi:hypothetical protein BN946_scf185016.g103 [Trametes cinnabarina]|uniref:Uncharacterized protein n=1 Tax=Pycnoporus cinnabarinus TaxID=5643 RepID=A0A060SIE0_PYCCI|nr:hypothetical protein BN946_scf185016.g103 [Trametes cinnabarina]